MNPQAPPPAATAARKMLANWLSNILGVLTHKGEKPLHSRTASKANCFDRSTCRQSSIESWAVHRFNGVQSRRELASLAVIARALPEAWTAHAGRPMAP